MRHPDPYTRCIRIGGSIDLERLKRLSRELQEDYERVHFSKSILDAGLRDIINRVNTVDHTTGMLRSADWASRRASQAIQEANAYETAAFDKEVASRSNLAPEA